MTLRVAAASRAVAMPKLSTSMPAGVAGPVDAALSLSDLVGEGARTRLGQELTPAPSSSRVIRWQFIL